MKGNWQYNQHLFVLLLSAKKPERERTNTLNNPPKHYDCPPQAHQGKLSVLMHMLISHVKKQRYFLPSAITLRLFPCQTSIIKNEQKNLVVGINFSWPLLQNSPDSGRKWSKLLKTFFKMGEQEIKYFIGCVPEYKINQLLLQLNEKEHSNTSLDECHIFWTLHWPKLTTIWIILYLSLVSHFFLPCSRKVLGCHS